MSEQEVVKFKRYVTSIEEAAHSIRSEIHLIGQRLREDRSRRDPRSYNRAYNELSRTVRIALNKIPEKAPTFALFDKPKEAAEVVRRSIKPDAPIQLLNYAGTIYMDCPKCDEWIDITKVFTQHLFSGVYKCPKGHFVLFSGVPATQEIIVENPDTTRAKQK